ncbi:hypothetical protein ACFLV3_05230 [Chloroflexota bacterium]
MKLSKKRSILLTVGIFAIILAILGTVRSQQVHEQKQLSDELHLVELKLREFQIEQLSHKQQELEKQLIENMSQPESVEGTLPQPPGSITANDTLFSIAEACGVEVTAIGSSGLARDELGGIPCYALTLTTRAEGNLSDLISFITMLNNDINNGIVRSAEIIVPAATDEQKPSAGIRLIVYTYQGDQL